MMSCDLGDGRGGEGGGEGGREGGRGEGGVSCDSGRAYNWRILSDSQHRCGWASLTNVWEVSPTQLKPNLEICSWSSLHQATEQCLCSCLCSIWIDQLKGVSRCALTNVQVLTRRRGPLEKTEPAADTADLRRKWVRAWVSKWVSECWRNAFRKHSEIVTESCETSGESKKNLEQATEIEKEKACSRSPERASERRPLKAAWEEARCTNGERRSWMKP